MIARTTRRIFEVAVLAALGLSILAGLAAWRLSQGPVNVGFLKGHLETALARIDLPVKIGIEGTSIAWAGWERALDVRVSGISIFQPDGKPVARIEDTSVRFSIRGLINGVLAPRSLDILDPTVRMARQADGKLEIALGQGGGPSDMAFTERLVAALKADDDPARPLTYLRRVSVLGARVVLDDRKTGTVWEATESDLIFLRDGAGLNASFSAQVDAGGQQMELSGTAALAQAAEKITIKGRVENLRPASLATKIGRLAPLRPIDLALGGSFTLGVSPGGVMRSVAFNIGAQEGKLVEKSLWDSPVAIRSARLRGRVDLDAQTASIPEFVIDFGGPVISASFNSALRDDVADIRLRSKFAKIAAADIRKIWPAGVAEVGRVWVKRNLLKGRVPSGEVQADLSFGLSGNDTVRINGLSGQARVEGGEVNYMDGLPHAMNASGTMILSPDELTFDIENGEAAGVRVESGKVTLAGLGTDREFANIDVLVRGSISNSVAIIDVPRLGYARKFGIDPKKLGGEARTRLRLSVPLLADVKFTELGIKAAASMTGAVIPGIAIEKKPITDGALTLEVDQAGLELSGTAKVGGIPANLRWVERFGEDERYVRRYEIKAITTLEQRETLGLGLLSDYVKGPAGVDLAVLQPSGDAPAQIVAKLELRDTQLLLPDFGWLKAPGQVALGWVSALAHKDGRVAIQNLNLTAGDLRISGALSLAANGDLQRLEIKRFQLGKTDLTASVEPVTGAPGYNVSLAGKSIDAVRLLEAGDSSPGEKKLPPIYVTLAIDEARVAPKTSFKDLAGRVVYDGVRWQQGALSAALSNGQKLALEYGNTPKEQMLTVRADNAGQVLSALGISESLKNGKLQVRIKKQNAAPKDGWAGVAEINNFNLSDAPVLTRVLTLGSLTGIVNTLSGGSIAFARFQAPFRLQNDIITFANARAVGSELGITGEGTYDLKRDLLDMKGTIVPAYTINSVLGNIPILGTILTGKKGSGVFAVTYRVVGPGDNPGVKVNPLSALAPGFLRNLVDIFDSKGKGAGVDASDPDASDAQGNN